MATTEVLQGTLFHWVYILFGVSTDGELMHRITLGAIIYTVFVGIASIFIPAPYGKHSSGENRFSISATTAWMVQEAPAFLVPIILIFQTPCLTLQESFVNKLSLFLFMVHYFYRTFIFPFRISASKPVPISSCILACVFTFYNGFLQGFYLTNIDNIKTSAYTTSGFFIFLTGMAINFYSDEILIGLRKNVKNNESKNRYKIPRGGLFELISGANYFGEIIEWWGLYVVTKGTPQLTFAVFSTVFLGLRATHHHQWYKTTFGNKYPSERKAIIPFVFLIPKIFECFIVWVWGQYRFYKIKYFLDWRIKGWSAIRAKRNVFLDDLSDDTFN